MKIFFLLLAITVYSCDAQVTTPKKQPLQSKTQSKPDFSVALNFINSYTKHCLSRNKKGPSTTTWVRLNNLLTPAFKTNYKTLVDGADPEFGLEFDPIFDAQDFPDKGFVILKTDASQGYVTVSGIGWKEFQVNLKIVQLNNKWLVDGAGFINIPENKRASR